jgi:hypothetical protein
VGRGRGRGGGPQHSPVHQPGRPRAAHVRRCRRRPSTRRQLHHPAGDTDSRCMVLRPRRPGRSSRRTSSCIAPSPQERRGLLVVRLVLREHERGAQPGPDRRTPGSTRPTLAEHRRMGSRWPAFSRIGSARGAWGARPAKPGEGLVGQGAFAEHRATLHFTGRHLLLLGAACSSPPSSAAAEGAAIGHALRLPRHRELPRSAGVRRRPATSRPSRPCCPTTCTCAGSSWARSSRILRLHSQHGQRLPWEYTGDAAVIAADFLRLRERLVPYLYTLGSRRRTTRGCRMVRALYLQWPALEEAYAGTLQLHAGGWPLRRHGGRTGPRADVGGVLASPRAVVRLLQRRGGRPGAATIVRDVTLAEYPVYARAGHHHAHAAGLAHQQRWSGRRAHAERVGRRRRRVRPLRRRRSGLRP